MAFPHHRLLAAEIQVDHLRIGRFPIVLIIVAASGRFDGCRIIQVHAPAQQVDHVRAVVQRLACAPTPEPMPVVMDEIVLESSTRSRSLPKLPVKPFRDGRFLADTDRSAVVRVPGFAEIDIPDRSGFDFIDCLHYVRPRAALVAHLDHPAVFLRRLDQHLAFRRRMAARFFQVNVLAGFHRQQSGGCMPMVRHGDHDGIHILMLECPAQVFVAGRLFTGDLIHCSDTFGQGSRIDIADTGDAAIRLFGKVLR